MSVRRGFTLLEIVVAIAVAGVVLLGARTLLESLAATSRHLSGAAGAADADANGERLLRTIVGRMEVAAESGLAFGGDEQSVRFTSWCDVPNGWLERCTVTLSVDSGSHPGESVVVALLETRGRSERIALRRGFARGSFRYLNDPADGGTWLRMWGRGLSAPLAFGVLLDGDTLIVRIGDRG
jgi:prepilin-type N-terminal cleavage/methylation domain-containing protein